MPDILDLITGKLPIYVLYYFEFLTGYRTPSTDKILHEGHHNLWDVEFGINKSIKL